MRLFGMRTSKGPARDHTKRGVNINKDMGETTSFKVREHLEDLLKREDLPASARVTAARTIAEIDGPIGRHQSAPDKGSSAMLASLSREQLQDELTRLRTLFDLGLVS